MSKGTQFTLGEQKGETLETIARFIGVHKSTVSREIRRNSTPNGKYVWNKIHDMAASRMRHTPGNRVLDDVPKWRIVAIDKERAMVAKADIRSSEEDEAVYAIIHNDESGELASHCRLVLRMA